MATIKLKRGTQAGATPASLADGEVAINEFDGKLFYKSRPSGAVTGVPLVTNPVTSVAGKTGAVVLTKGDVGLSAVDNTSDMNKPVSTAQRAALDAKQNDLGLTGIATQQEAEAGSVNDKAMTPLRVAQAIAELAGAGGVEDVRLGAESQTSFSSAGANYKASTGNVLTGLRTGGGGNYDISSFFARPLQKKISGSWVTVSHGVG